MRFPVVVAFLASIFTSVLLSHLATTTPTAHHDSFASDPAAAGDDSAAANDANATAAVGDVATSRREDFRFAENPVKDLRILSRKKRFICGGLCIAAGLALSGVGIALSTGFGISAEIGSAQNAATQQRILTKLNDLDTKMHNLANDIQGLQTQLNDFESKLTLSLIKDELNYLKNTVDHLKQTTIDSNGKYGPSTLFGHNQIPGRLRTLRHALDNFQRYITTGHPSFDQKPLVQWYFSKTGSTEKALAFKGAMIAHQLAGYEFLKILYVASCQQSNPDKPVGWCHADEAAKTTTEVTNTEKTRMETQLKAEALQTIAYCPNCVSLASYGSSQYRLVKTHKSWDAARSFCQFFFAGDLVSFEGDAEWRHVWAEMKRTDGGSYHWIGGRKTSQWKWLTGGEISMGRTAWDDDWKYWSGDCLCSHWPSSYGVDSNWLPVSCSRQYHFTCEFH